MAKHKKSSTSSKISNGGRQKQNVNHEAKRQAYFAKKREEGRAYVYKKNPYDPEKQPEEWATENYKRQQKNQNHRLPFAQLKTFFAKLDNQLAENERKKKEALETSRDKKIKTKNEE